MISTRSSIRTEIAIAAIASAIALATAPSFAQENGAIAESLFREGKALMEKKDYEHACPKFKESVRLDASSGSALALALCYQGQGKTASAWGAFVNAASLARRDGRKDRESAANAGAAELEPKLSRVTIEIAPETRTLDELEVKQDDLTIGPAAWTASPVDPGAHALIVTAARKKPYKTQFVIGKDRSIVTVKVPALEDEPVVAPPPSASSASTSTTPPPPPPPPPHESGAMRTTGFVLAGLGVASLATGGVFGGLALSKIHDVKKACPSSPCTDARAVSEDHDAGTLADVSTITIAVGAVGAIVGTIFVLASPSHEEKTGGVTVHPVVGLGTAGIRGEF